MSLDDMVREITSETDKGRANHDRISEIFAAPVSERPWSQLFTSLATSDTFREKMWAREPFVVEAEAAGTAGTSFVTRSFLMCL